MLEHLHVKLLTLVGPTALVAALVAAPTLAHATELAPPTLPAESPAPAPATDPAPAPATAPAPASTNAPPIANAPAVPAPRAEGSLSLTGTALWDGLNDLSVRLTLRNENELQGIVVAQDRDTIALARASDGSVVAVPKREIKSVGLLATSGSAGRPANLPPIADRPHDDGRKLHGGGVAMLSLGVPLGLAGTTMLGIWPGGAVIWGPTLIPGIALIVGGSIALKRSNQRRDAFHRAWGIPGSNSAKLQWTPTLSAGRRGGQLGVAMRF